MSRWEPEALSEERECQIVFENNMRIRRASTGGEKSNLWLDRKKQGSK